MGILLTILGIVLIVSGVLGVLRGQLLWGIAAIVVGLFVAPGYFYGL
ncbi:GPGG-motif small membrane protein [Nocardiopsis alba]